LKTFKNDRAIDIHIKRAHDISDEEYATNKKFLKSWNRSSEGSYLKFLAKKGALN